MSEDGPDDDYFDDDEYADDDDDLYEDCGMMADGYCTMAGSEHCDWDCPLAQDRTRSRIRAMKAGQK